LRRVPAAELPMQEASERVIGAAVVHAGRDFASHALSLLCVSPHSLVPPHVPPNVCRLLREKKNKYSSKRKTQFYPLKPPSKMSSGLIKIPHYNGDWQTRRRKRFCSMLLSLSALIRYIMVCARHPAKKPLQMERERACMSPFSPSEVGLSMILFRNIYCILFTKCLHQKQISLSIQ
jgi:hypothetical protein